MKEVVKLGGIQLFAQFGMCTLLCGAVIGFLTATGGLLMLANEGRNKTFLIPSLIVFAIALVMYIKYKKSCSQKTCLTLGDRMLGMMLFMLLSGVISMLFTLYVFIPWWIPGYEGGPLLP